MRASAEMSALFHQASLCEFQIEFKFWMEDKKSGGRNTEVALWG